MLLYAILAVLLIVAIVPEVKRHDARKLQRLIDGDGSEVRRFDAGNADLLPVVLDEGRELLPAANDAPVVRIGGPAPAPSYTVERKEAIHAATIETSVIIPFQQALITAIIAGVSVWVLCWVLAWSWRVPVVVFALTLAGGWLWRLRFADSLLQRIETMTGLDLDHNGRIGASPSHAYTVANPGMARQTAATAQRETAASERQTELLEFVRRCYLVGTSESAHGVKATGPDRERYTAARDSLIGLGVAGWRNPERPRGGWRMLVKQDEALAIVAAHVL